MIAPPPGLARLRLNAGYLAALARQGFVSKERRSGGRTIFKLRLRHGGRQIVRYIGQDAAVAEQIRRELREMQVAAQRKRELRRLAAAGRELLRSTKERLRVWLEREGFVSRIGSPPQAGSCRSNPFGATTAPTYKERILR